MIVLVDTKEQMPWHFEGAKNQSLKTGDYTLEGFENILCIERKRNTGEFAKNICEARFVRELERMIPFKYSFIICEFDIHDVMSFPHNSGIPKKVWHKLRTKSQFLFGRINDFRIQYGVQIILAGAYARDTAFDIMKRVYKYESSSKSTD